jgi:benzoate transport
MAEAVAYPASSPAVLKTAWLVVAICTVINMLDGFDVLAIAFTAPHIAAAWQLQPTQIGILLSAGLAGMTLGSLLLSPIGDVLGRRTVLLACLAIVSGAMIASAFCSTVMQLAICRFVTGLGIGGMLSGITTVTAEYAPPERRNFAIGLVTVGYPIGATLGGMAAIPLIAQFGWTSVFIFGGLLSLAMIPVVWLALPESLAFLLSRQPHNALSRANDVLQRLDRAPLAALPERRSAEASERKTLLDIFRPGLAVATVLICTAFFLNMFSFYFVMSWTPKVVVDMGLPPDIGITASVLLNLFGVVGGVLCGYLSERYGVARVTGIYMVMTFVSMVVLSLVPATVPAVLAAASFLGFFMLATMVGLYSIVAAVFPTHVRTTGTGVAIGIGRLGAVAGPYSAGVLIQAGWQRPAYWAALGVPVLLAAAVTAIAARRRRTFEVV